MIYTDPRSFEYVHARPQTSLALRIVVALLAFAFALLIVCGIASAAEYQILVCEPAKPCVLKRYVYDQHTACVTDTRGEAILRVAGTHVECIRIEARNGR